jgi:hypothetical protein
LLIVSSDSYLEGIAMSPTQVPVNSPTAPGTEHDPRSAYRPRLGVPRLLTFIAVGLVAIGGTAYFLLPESEEITGTVTLDGQPLNGGIIEFHPVDGGDASHAVIKPDGQFALHTDGTSELPPGEYVVTVAENQPLEEPATSPPSQVIPAQFTQPETSDIRITLGEETTVVDVRLESPEGETAE